MVTPFICLEVEHLPPPDKEQTMYNFEVSFVSGEGKDEMQNCM